MKRLTVLRHAKSSWDDEELDDFDRPLNDRGWKAARRMGRELKRRGMQFDFAFASPAARARETLDGLAEGYGQFGFAVKFEPRVYGADTATLLELLRRFRADTERALLVGHNPGLERLIIELTKPDGNGFRDRVLRKFPTGALATIELAVNGWTEVTPGRGTVVELILPKELD